MSSTTATPQDERYNGWKNYPTWAVNLWLSNDEGLYNTTRDLVSSARYGAKHSEPSERVLTADTLKAWVRDDLAPDLGASFAADLLGYALDCVDWFEIADAWLEDAV
jgi:hypothetical protein